MTTSGADLSSAAECPVRKLSPGGEAAGPAVDRVSGAGGDRWVVRSFDAARAVFRDFDAVRQAGFGAEQMTRTGSRMRLPILYLEGDAHRQQRRASARFFAPKVVEDYRPGMESLSRQLLAPLGAGRPIDLSQVSLAMAVQVAAQVIGLTNSSMAGMTRRLNTFFLDPVETPSLRSPGSVIRSLRTSTALLRFYHLDVKPAIRARRRERREDVISQLLDSGFRDLDILTECVTYGAAGMVTTREFIQVAAWHLLDSPTLLARYRAGDPDERLVILNEALRLEPVVGHLFRRSTAPLTLPTPDGPIEVASGALIDLDIRAINADAAAVGADPLQLCPGRDLPRTVPPSLMSFGDGNHKCPGASIALLESEIFLTELFRQPVAADGPPRVRWNAMTQGYELDRFRLRSFIA